MARERQHFFDGSDGLPADGNALVEEITPPINSHEPPRSLSLAGLPAILVPVLAALSRFVRGCSVHLGSRR